MKVGWCAVNRFNPSPVIVTGRRKVVLSLLFHLLNMFGALLCVQLLVIPLVWERAAYSADHQLFRCL